MIIAPDFVFLCIPRCASNTMREWLKRFGGVSHEPHHGRFIPLEHRHKFTFAIVRNPYDRMLSMWYHTRRNSPDAEWREMDVVTFARRCHETEYGMSQRDFLEPAWPLRQIVQYEFLATWPYWLGEMPNPWGHPPAERRNAEDRPPWGADPNLGVDFIDAVNHHSLRDFDCWNYERL